MSGADCPRCGAAMQQQTLDAHHGRSIVIDLCHPCRSIWFDTRESPSLTPGSTLSLFRVIGEHIAGPAGSRADLAKCPRCRARLQQTQDMQRATRFQYLRSPHGHGRLTTFFDFLREKNFIRPLTSEQITELRRNIQIVNCSNCGAPDSRSTRRCRWRWRVRAAKWNRPSGRWRATRCGGGRHRVLASSLLA